jgi:protein-disulfide isomerase/uncharacterized membrane protein
VRCHLNQSLSIEKRKKFLAAAAVFTFAAILVHAYLAYRHYLLHMGAASEASICNLNATFNCDAVAASQYSSLMGIPLALWGAVTNGILLLMTLVYMFGMSENNERFGRYTFGLSIFVVLTSVVMGGIATTMGAYCIFCMAAYAASLLTFEFIRRSQTSPFFKNLPEDFSNLFSRSKAVLIMLISIPLLTFLFNGMFSQQFGGSSRIRSQIEDSINEWKQSTPYQFQTDVAIKEGNPEAKVEIVEFADFRCGHCKMAKDSLKAFVASHKNVKLNFMYFPLDADCNPAIERSNGLSCHLAKTSFCANRMGEGWPAHEWMFNHQEEFLQSASLEDMNKKLKNMADELKLNWPELLSCATSDATHEAVKSSAIQGKNAKVEGTPSIYVNGRYLPGGQILGILEKAVSEL